MTLMPADTYIVINKTMLSNDDRNIITMLYQPIIGHTATNLYFTLWSNLDHSQIVSLVHTHHNLMTMMRVKLSAIIEAREKLEAIGLIKTYLKNDSVNNYIYELYSPLSAYEFISNPILNITLANNLGKNEYKKIIEYFKIPKINLKDYKDISSKFSDVFTVTNAPDLNDEANNLKHSKSLDFDIEGIDLNNIFSNIPEEVINIKCVTNSVRDLINKISFIYNLNEDDLTELIRNSVNEKHGLDKNKFRENAKNFYKFENKGELPSLIYKKQPQYLRKETSSTSKKAKTIHMFETTTPYEFLLGKNRGIKPSKSDLNLVEILLVEYELNPGVVNVLIDYVLRINDNKLTKSYTEAIASQWKRSNITTVEDAMAISLKEYKAKGKTSKKKTAKTPSWFNQNIESEEASEEEIKALEEKLKVGVK